MGVPGRVLMIVWRREVGGEGEGGMGWSWWRVGDTAVAVGRESAAAAGNYYSVIYH